MLISRVANHLSKVPRLNNSAGQKKAITLRRTSDLTKNYGRGLHGLGNIKEVAKFPVDQLSRYSSDSDFESNRAFNYFVIGACFSGIASTGKNLVMPILKSMGAASDVVAMANVEIDVSSIQEGEAVTFKYRGKPLFVRHRTPAEIEASVSAPLSELPDPEPDEARYRGAPEWLVLVGICTHLGCVPLNAQGAYNGWFCPCHGSHYDTSGRIRLGPAPRNMEIPPYHFIDSSRILVGLNAAAA